MKIRFQADADLNQKIVAGIRRGEPSIDCLTAHEGGVIGLPDPEVLRIAAVTGRVLLSHDRRTIPLHFREVLQTLSSAGVILIPQSLSLGAVIEEIVLIWAASDPVEWRDHIAHVPL